MKLTCKYCHRTVHGQFRDGAYHFAHCGHKWSAPAKKVGQIESHHKGTTAGAVLGAAGAVMAAINPLGGLLVGALVGSAFNGDNRKTCHKCGSPAYPTGRRGRQGDPMYQCSSAGCRAFTFLRG